MLGFKYCKVVPESELSTNSRAYIHTLYVRFVDLTKTRRSENTVLGVGLVIEAFPVVKFKGWSQGQKVKQQIEAALQGQQWLNQNDFFGSRSMVMLLSPMKLKVDLLLKNQWWKRIHAI